MSNVLLSIIVQVKGHLHSVEYISQEGRTQPYELETAKKLWTYWNSTFSPLATGLMSYALSITCLWLVLFLSSTVCTRNIFSACFTITYTPSYFAKILRRNVNYIKVLWQWDSHHIYICCAQIDPSYITCIPLPYKQPYYKGSALTRYMFLAEARIGKEP